MAWHLATEAARSGSSRADTCAETRMTGKVRGEGKDEEREQKQRVNECWSDRQVLVRLPSAVLTNLYSPTSRLPPSSPAPCNGRKKRRLWPLANMYRSQSVA